MTWEFRQDPSLGSQDRVVRQSYDIDTLFPGWRPGDERVFLFCPHDDDGALGAGLGIQAVHDYGGQVFIDVVTDGAAGNCTGEDNGLVDKRARETVSGYGSLGIGKGNIHFHRFPDGQLSRLWFTGDKRNDGLTRTFTERMRDVNATRLLIPYEGDPHTDHWGVARAALEARNHADKEIWPDLGAPTTIMSVLAYHAYPKGAPHVHVIGSHYALARKENAIREWHSQKQIEGLIAHHCNGRPRESYTSIK